MRMIILLLMMFFILNNNVTMASEAKNQLFMDAMLSKKEAWLDQQNGDDIIMDQVKINALNERMQADNMPGLQKYPTKLSGEELAKYLQEYEIDTDLYVKGKLLTASQIAALKADCNLSGVQEETEVRYAVVVKRSDLRSLPTDLKAFSTLSDTEFDMWQETAVDPAEPVLVLHYNQKHSFVYVQMRNYRGWLPVEAIALTDRDRWLQFVCPQSFAVVTGKLLRLADGNAKWSFQMGSRIPTEGKALLLPVRDVSGNLKITKVSAKYDKNLNDGYLPYTTNNLVKQAFRFLNSPYGWGGLKESVDCSSFVADVYRTVGIELPRNADEQEEAYTGTAIDLSAYEGKDKLRVVNNLPIGSALFMPDHVMLYLGSKKGRPYIIHALGSYGSKEGNGEYKRVAVMKVIVSDTFLRNRSGRTFQDILTTAQSFR